MMNTLTTLSFSLTSCCVCGILFGIPKDLSQNLQDNKNSWWCPNGHRQNYTGTTTRELLAEAKEDLKTQRQARWSAEDKVGRQAKQLTDLRRRVKGTK